MPIAFGGKLVSNANSATVENMKTTSNWSFVNCKGNFFEGFLTTFKSAISIVMVAKIVTTILIERVFSAAFEPCAFRVRKSGNCVVKAPTYGLIYGLNGFGSR